MPITSSDEILGSRLNDLERRFDALISQDKPGSQLFTATHIPFGGTNGALTSDANLTWNNTNKRLGIGTTAPGTTLQVLGTSGVAALNSIANSIATFQASTTVQLQLGALAGSPYSAWLQAMVDYQNTSYPLVLNPAGGNVGIGTDTPVATLHVARGTGINGAAYIQGTTHGCYFHYSTAEDIYLRGGKTGSHVIMQDAHSGGVGIGGVPTRKLSLITSANEYISFGTITNERWLMGIEAANTAASYITWYDSSSGQHRMRLGGDANLHIQNALYIGNVSTTPSYQIHLSADSAGKPTTNVWTVVSDDKTKLTKKPFNHGIEALRAFPSPIEFTYNGDYGTPIDDVPGVGYSAQDILEAAPKMIKRVRAKKHDEDEADEELLAVNSGALQQMMHNAILELDKRIDTLEKRGNNGNN